MSEQNAARVLTVFIVAIFVAFMGYTVLVDGPRRRDHVTLCYERGGVWIGASVRYASGEYVSIECVRPPLVRISTEPRKP